MSGLDEDTDVREIKLVGAGGDVNVTRSIAMQSNLLKSAIENDDSVTEVKISDVKSEVLEFVVEYMKHNATDASKSIPKPLPKGEFKDFVSEWDFSFVQRIGSSLFEVVHAANYMDVPSLLELLAANIACIRCKTPAQIRAYFNIPAVDPSVDAAKKADRIIDEEKKTE